MRGCVSDLYAYKMRTMGGVLGAQRALAMHSRRVQSPYRPPTMGRCIWVRIRRKLADLQMLCSTITQQRASQALLPLVGRQGDDIVHQTYGPFIQLAGWLPD